jgi:hypothetical protein
VSLSTIIVAKRSEESRIASLMTLAFANDPVMRYLYPDQLQFLTYFPRSPVRRQGLRPRLCIHHGRWIWCRTVAAAG